MSAGSTFGEWTSFGHLNVMRVEVMQLLEEAFRILDADDVKRLFGADNAWDVVEEVLIRYFNEKLVTSPRQRMAVAGRDVMRWLGQPHILKTDRAVFETLLLDIAESCEEWLTSATSMGLAERTGDVRVLPWERAHPTPGRGQVAFAYGSQSAGAGARQDGAGAHSPGSLGERRLIVPARHDHRLPLPRREGRWPDRPLEHRRAARRLSAPGARGGDHRHQPIARISHRLPRGQPRGRAPGRARAAPIHRIRVRSRRSRFGPRPRAPR